VSLGHSIDPIVPQARTATARTACLMLVRFMEASIVRAQYCAWCLWAIDPDQSASLAYLQTRSGRGLVRLPRRASIPKDVTGSGTLTPKTRALDLQGNPNRRFSDCLDHVCVDAVRNAAAAQPLMASERAGSLI
jgi:hypothetical protein